MYNNENKLIDKFFSNGKKSNEKIINIYLCLDVLKYIKKKTKKKGKTIKLSINKGI